MHITEIEDQEDKVGEAMESWFEMWQPSKQIPIILSAPEAKDFKTANADTIYRCYVLTRDGKIRGQKKNSKVAVYTMDQRMAHEFYHSLDIANKYIVVAKQFHPKDLILNFSAFANSKGRSGGWDEKELWMKPTPYYTSVQPSEIVFRSK
jgi:hypothetical protein